MFWFLKKCSMGGIMKGIYKKYNHRKPSQNVKKEK